MAAISDCCPFDRKSLHEVSHESHDDALILNDQKIADRSSRMDLRKNADGSVDIYCGPKPPAGFEKNWIPTVPGKNWFAYFRFYQPTEAYFDRSWPLPDFEQISGESGEEHAA